MKILVVSDTHRNYNVLEGIIGNDPADMLIHLGDGEREFEDVSNVFPQFPMVYVGGNCDYGTHKTLHIVKAEGHNILCCHGHTLGVRAGTGLLVSAAVQNGCDIALYGHTHLYKTEVVNGVHVMNPGSPSEPRGGNKPSYGVIELADGRVDMKIVILER
ncbi:MAG: metallophosphoesterase [Ruminococcaceae bacterium]|nr:metallophosphoesterase [Oscillospiraceae bacterium]